MLLLLGALILTACNPSQTAPPACRSTPSGLPVPRFVSLKYDPANARGGPGDDYRLLWIYHHKGLPLLVVEETAEWRRVRDPEGQLAWVHKRVIDGTRTVMRTDPSDLSLRDRPALDARVTAVLAGHAIATLTKCQGDWCKISADHATGWALRDSLWGTLEPGSGPGPGDGCHAP